MVLNHKTFNLEDHFEFLVCPEFVVLYIYLLRVWDRLEILYGLCLKNYKLYGLY